MRINAKCAGKLLALPILICAAAFVAPTVFAQEARDDFHPAPPSIGADVPLTYFGPAPSEVRKELIGPYKNLKAGKVDQDRGR
jgi:hypothetical protein